MATKGLLLSILLVGTLHSTAEGQNCAHDHPTETYHIIKREFYAQYRGPIQVTGTRESMLATMATCSKDVTEKMIGYFESYGVDCSSMRQDPYGIHDNSRFSLTPCDDLSQEQPTEVVGAAHYEEKGLPYWGGLAVAMRTPYGISRLRIISMHTRQYFAEWYLNVKQPTSGPRGHLQENDSIMYGMIRMAVDGEDVCMDYNTHDVIRGNPYMDPELQYYMDCHNAHWGACSIIGSAIVTNSTASYTHTISFPPAQP